MKTKTKTNKQEFFLVQVEEDNSFHLLKSSQEVKELFGKNSYIEGLYFVDGEPVKAHLVTSFFVPTTDGTTTGELLAKSLLERLEQIKVKGATKHIPVSMHSQKQKQGNPKQSIFNILRQDKNASLKETQAEYNIEVVGIELTVSEEKALFAIQNMLSKTNYKGNAETSKHSDISDYTETRTLPSLEFSPSEFLTEYGVSKKDHGRGYAEFSRAERDLALSALRELSVKPFFVFYKRVSWEKGKERIQLIKITDTLIKVIEGYDWLNKTELTEVASGGANNKLVKIVIVPNPVLVDQIKSHYVMKPANCYQEIKLLAPHASKFVYRFIDYLLTEQTLKEKNKGWDWTIKIGVDTLADVLRMDAYVKKRNWRTIRASVNKCYEVAKKLGYLTNYEIDQQGVAKNIDVLTLNKEKFYRVEKTKQKIIEIEQETADKKPKH